MANIRQTDLLEYLVNQFNKNSFEIKFVMGTYEGDSQKGLVINAPVRSKLGDFDVIETYNESTYQVSEESFVVMGGQIMNGEYTALPNVQLVSYDITLNFLVYADTPISEIIRMAIEEVRDNLIGALDVFTIKEIDLEDDENIIETHLMLATTADSIDFGDYIEIKGKRYLEFSLPVGMTVSKNVELGNQFVWKIKEVNLREWAVSDEAYWDEFGEVSGEFDLDQRPNTSPQPNDFPNADNVLLDTAGRIAYDDNRNGRCFIGEILDPEITDSLVCINAGGVWQPDVLYAYYRVQEIVSAEHEEVIPLIASIGASQDMESFQTLNSLNPETAKLAKEVHNIVKSRGFGMVLTFLFDSKKPIIRTLFKECFSILDEPSQYDLVMEFKELNEDGEFEIAADLTFNRKLVVGEAEPGDIIYGTPVVFSIGFVVSAKE